MFKLITILHENFTIFKSCFFKTGQIDYGVVKKVPWFISIQHHSAFQFLLPRLWTGLLLVQRRVATHLHGHPLAAEDDVAGRGTVQRLQLLLCNGKIFPSSRRPGLMISPSWSGISRLVMTGSTILWSSSKITLRIPTEVTDHEWQQYSPPQVLLSLTAEKVIPTERDAVPGWHWISDQYEDSWSRGQSAGPANLATSASLYCLYSSEIHWTGPTSVLTTHYIGNIITLQCPWNTSKLIICNILPSNKIGKSCNLVKCII